jgi:hypothetical protein
MLFIVYVLYSFNNKKKKLIFVLAVCLIDFDKSLIYFYCSGFNCFGLSFHQTLVRYTRKIQKYIMIESQNV